MKKNVDYGDCELHNCDVVVAHDHYCYYGDVVVEHDCEDDDYDDDGEHDYDHSYCDVDDHCFHHCSTVELLLLSWYTSAVDADTHVTAAVVVVSVQQQ
ncbi:hypothetical protein D3C80_1972470 [compost metagenome]